MSEHQLVFKPASKEALKPFIGLFGKSGSGKTFSALMLARGIAGPTGKIGLIDTENRRGSAYVDLIAGGYEVLNLDPPFSPERYTQCLDAAEKAGIDALVVDSATHEWNGEGGYLSMKSATLDRMAGSDWKKRDACAMVAAAQCKPLHNRFVDRLCRCSMAVVLCFRGHEKVRVTKDEESGKTKPKTDQFCSPIQESGLIFEMLISAEIVRAEDGRPGCLRLDARDPQTKWTHPALLRLLPKEGEQVTVEHGSAIAGWATSAGEPAKPPIAAGNDQKRAKKALFDATRSIHDGDMPTMLKWLDFNNVFSGTVEELGASTTGSLKEMQAKAEIILSE